MARKPKQQNQEEQTPTKQIQEIEVKEQPKATNSQLYDVKMEAIRVIPLLLDAIRVMMSKRTITPVDKQIIKLRLESGSSLLAKIKGLDT